MNESFEPVSDKKQFDDYLDFTKRLADIADEISMSFFNQQQSLQVSLKSDGSFEMVGRFRVWCI